MLGRFSSKALFLLRQIKQINRFTCTERSCKGVTAISFDNYFPSLSCVVGPINKVRNSTFKCYLF